MIDNSSLYKSPESHAFIMAQYDTALNEWPVAHESRYVATRHGQTHVLIAGDQTLPPIVFFHGWGGNATHIGGDYDLPTLTQHYCIYAPDTIGQLGRSAPNQPSIKGAAYGEWAFDLFDALDIQQAIVGGISGGGFLSLKIAAHAPDRVSKAFIISTAGISSMVPLPLRTLWAALPLMLRPNLKTARWFMRRIKSPAVEYGESQEGMAQGMLMIGKHCKKFGFPAALEDDELRRITAPVFMLMGKHDISCSVNKVIKRARRLIPQIETEIVPDGGHLLTMEHWALVNERLQAFIQP